MSDRDTLIIATGAFLLGALAAAAAIGGAIRCG